MNTSVTMEWLTVRLGNLAARKVHVRLAEISKAELVSLRSERLSPGCGIRPDELTGIFALNQAVQLHLVNGDIYYLGSLHPERLLAIIHSLMDIQKEKKRVVERHIRRGKLNIIDRQSRNQHGGVLYTDLSELLDRYLRVLCRVLSVSLNRFPDVHV